MLRAHAVLFVFQEVKDVMHSTENTMFFSPSCRIVTCQSVKRFKRGRHGVRMFTGSEADPVSGVGGGSSHEVLRCTVQSEAEVIQKPDGFGDGRCQEQVEFQSTNVCAPREAFVC